MNIHSYGDTKSLSASRKRTAERIVLVYIVVGVAWVLFSDYLLTMLVADPVAQGWLQTTKGWFYVAMTALLLHLLVRRGLATVTQSEEALQESEERFRGAFNEAPIGIGIIGLDGRYTQANQALCRISGYTEEELKGIKWQELVHVDDLEGALANREQMRAANRDMYSYEGRLCHKGGHPVWVRVGVSLVKSSDGSLLYSVTHIDDVSESKRGEEALRSGEERFHAIFEGAFDALIIFDDDGQIVDANSVAYKWLGITREKSERHVFGNVLPDQDLSRAQEFFRQIFSNEKSGSEISVVRPDGQAREVEYQVSKDLLPGYHLAVLHDITERKEAERGLQRRNAELTALHETTLGLINHLDVTNLLDAIVGKAGALAETPHAYVYVVEKSGDGSEELAVRAGTGIFATQIGLKLAQGKGLAGRVWETGRTIVVDDYHSWEGRRHDLDNMQIRTVVGVPLHTNVSVAGVIGLVFFEEGRKVTQEEIELLERFAYLAAIALENARLYTEAQRQARELGLLDQVRTALIQELDTPSVYHTVVEAVAKTFGYTQVSLFEIQGEKLVMQHQVGYKQSIKELSLGRGVMGRVARTGVPALVADVNEDDAFVGATEDIESEVCVPLCDHDRVVGVLNLESMGNQRLNEDDLKLMMALSEQVNLAIGRARLYTEVKASEDRFRAIFENTLEAITMLDDDGRKIDVNPAACNLYGLSREELIGKNFLDFITQEDQETAWQHFQDALEDGEDEGEVRIIRPDGQHRDVEYTTKANARPGYHLRVLNDVTERKRAGQALRESEERYRSLVETSPDAIIMSDLKGKILLRNTYASVLRGFEQARQVAEPSLFNFILAEDRERAAADLANLIREGSVRNVEYRLMKVDGVTFPAEINASVVKDAQGEPQWIVAIMRDVTERHRTEEMLMERAASQAELLRQLLTAQEAERKRLSMDIHDGPLQSLGVALLALDRSARRQQLGQLEGASHELQELRTTLTDTVSEVRAVLADLSMETLTSYGLSSALRDHAQRFAEVTGIAVEIESTLGGRLPNQIELLMYRLAQEALANVRKHADAHNVSIRLKIADERLLMAVADDGKGFELKEARAIRGGAGERLGLRSMQERVRHAQGGLAIKSAPGQGTTLEFWCPLPDGIIMSC